MQPKTARLVSEQVLWLRHDVASTPMHVIKLVYLCHGWMLGIHGRSLIQEAVEAWRYGPVVPEVYRRYRAFGGDPISAEPIDRSADFDAEQKALIEAVSHAYRNYEAWELSAITHTPGTPWHRVYANGAGQGAIIPNPMIQEHYQQAAS